jgi:hypothetical protein
MPDPVWTMQYMMNQTPEGNGFTRAYDYPIAAAVNAVTGGSPANRRVEIDARAGNDCGIVFLTSTIPSLDFTKGATLETIVNVSGDANGDAGMELTFLSYAVLLMIHPNKACVYSPEGDDGTPGFEVAVNTDSNNADLKWRITFDTDHNVRVYRDSALLIGPLAAPIVTKPFQRVLWWAESGVLAVWRAFRFYVGGAVAAG